MLAAEMVANAPPSECPAKMIFLVPYVDSACCTPANTAACVLWKKAQGQGKDERGDERGTHFEYALMNPP